MTEQHPPANPQVPPDQPEANQPSRHRRVADFMNDRKDRAANYLKTSAERAAKFVKDRSRQAGEAVKARSNRMATYIRREFHRPIPSLLVAITVTALAFAGYVTWSGSNERDALRAQLASHQQASGSVAGDQSPLATLQRTIAHIGERTRQAQLSLEQVTEGRDARREEIAALQAQIADAQERLKTQRAEVAEVTRQLQQAKEGETVAREEVASLRSEVDGLRQEVTTLTEQKEQLNRSTRDAEAKLAKLRDVKEGDATRRTDAIEAELKSARSELAQAQEALAKVQRVLARPDAPHDLGQAPRSTETTGQTMTPAPTDAQDSTSSNIEAGGNANTNSR